MKKLLAMLMALALTCGATALADTNALGLAVLSRLFDGKDNQFVSPLSLTCALSMAATGADADTLDEIRAACGFDDPLAVAAWNAPLEASGLRWANAAFAQADLPVRQDYIDALAAHFGAELFPLDDADRVNAWVDAHTDHLIDRLVDELDPEIRLMLVNAIAMDAKWAHRFDEGDTWTDAFHAPSGDVDAEFMHDTFHMDYGENDLAQFIRLNYRDSGLSMLVALPREGRLTDALAGIARDGLAWFGDMGDRKIRLSLPKLDVSVSNSLTDALQALGIRRAFTDDAQFPGISEQPLKVSDVLQKVRVQVDEEGTRAAAVTATMMKAAGAAFGEEPPMEFNVNRPYIVLIVEENTGAVCFAGAVCDPTRS